MASKAKRPAVNTLHDKGIAPAAISRTLQIPLSTVCRQIKRYEELGTVEDRHRSGRPATACTPTNREKIRHRIKRNPERSMRKMAKELGICEKSVRKMVEMQLGYRPYKLRKGQLLREQMKKNRLRKARKLKRIVAAGRYRSVLFTDEKVFTVERHHNHHNDRQLLRRGSSKLPTIMRSHYPASVMVWAGITSDGKTPLVFVDKGVKINARFYQEEILRGALHPWAQEHFAGRQWILQQDWAPAHGAKTRLALCERLFPEFWGKDIWPANSPDLNPMDYAIWSILEQKVSARSYNTVDALKRALIRAWNEISVEQLATIVNDFPKRLSACISAGGGHFEK
jgi:transposase